MARLGIYVLVEDDCESIGGAGQTCTTPAKPCQQAINLVHRAAARVLRGGRSSDHPAEPLKSHETVTSREDGEANSASG